jgi:hypothetical protein
MRRYYFHLHAPSGVSRDATGVRLPDMAAAVREAIRAAGYIVRAPAKEPHTDWRGWRIEVVDDLGQPCFTLPFENALQRAASGGGRLKDGTRGKS